MKLVVVSDIHANYPALEAVAENEEDVDGYIVVGDMVGLLGYPNETVKFAMENSIEAVKGNHDISVVENKEGHVNSDELSQFELKSTLTSLNQEQKNWIKNLDSYVKNADIGIVIAHAQPYPEMSTGLEYRNAGLTKGNYTKAASDYDDDLYDYVVVGHTHNQAKLDCGKFGNDITVFNPGSVGQPLDSGTAEYAVIENGQVELKSVEYDSEQVKEHLTSIGVPFKWWERY